MNQATSQDVFVGPYLDDPEVRAKFSKSYYAMTDGFLVRAGRVGAGWEDGRGRDSKSKAGATLVARQNGLLLPAWSKDLDCLVLWAPPCLSAGVPHLPARHRGVEGAQGPHVHL